MTGEGTFDEDDLFENAIFSSPQHFLSFCQTQGCGFDERRRAKYSTMKVLFELQKASEEDHVERPNEETMQARWQLLDDHRRKLQQELYS